MARAGAIAPAQGSLRYVQVPTRRVGDQRRWRCTRRQHLADFGSLNLHGMFMSITTVLNSAFMVRLILLTPAGTILALATMATAIGVVAKDNFLANVSNFILLLTDFLIPWTSINLADFHVIRMSGYNIDDLFKPRRPLQGRRLARHDRVHRGHRGRDSIHRQPH